MALAQEMIERAMEIRERLRNPANAVTDNGINLKRKRIPQTVRVVVTVEQVATIQPEKVIEYHEEDMASLCKPVSFLAIIDEVMAYFGLSESDFFGHKRIQKLADARHISFYLGKLYSNHSMKNMSRILGGRDHTTGRHGYMRIAGLITVDDQLAKCIKEIELRLLKKQQLVRQKQLETIFCVSTNPESNV